MTRKQHSSFRGYCLIVLAMLIAGCAGRAPKVEDPPSALNSRQAQLAYHHFSDAASLFAMGEYAEAAEAYERALRLDPASFEIRLSLAETYFRLRQFPRVVSIAQAVEPKDASVFELLGRAYAYMGRDGEAREAYLKLVERDSTNAQAYWFLSRQAMRRGQLTEAAGYLQRLSHHRSVPRVFNELGNLHVRMGAFDDAADAYRQSLDRDSSRNNRRAYLGLAGAEESLGRFEAAAEAYRRAIAMTPDDLSTRRRLLGLYLHSEAYDSAMAAIETILEYNPDDPERIRLGAILYTTGRYAKAESLFTAMVEESGGTDYIAIFYLGRIAEAQEDHPRAKAYFERATVVSDTIPDAWIHWGTVLLNEDSLSAALVVGYRALDAVTDPAPFWYFLGLAFARNDFHDSAIVWFERARDDDTSDTRVQFSLGAALERAGRFGEAAVIFLNLLEQKPTHAAALNYLGYMYADSGMHLEESLDMIERALEQDPDNGAYLDSFGWVLFRLGRYAEAENQIRRALDVLQSDATVYDHLGDILAATGRREEARETWRRALELNPADARIRDKVGP